MRGIFSGSQSNQGMSGGTPVSARALLTGILVEL
jgi:hypothetical protein